MKTKLINIGLLTLIGLYLVGCGSSKITHDESSDASRDLPGTLTTTGQVTNNDGVVIGYYATCNKFAQQNVNGVLTSYFDPVSYNFVSDLIRLELSKVPSTLLTGSDVYLQLYRWYLDSSDNQIYNKTAVGMIFQYQDGTWLNTDPITVLSKSTIQKLISDNKLADRGVTLSNFLARTLVVLTGMDIMYDAISIKTFDQAQGKKAIGSFDVLLPAFAADPNIYAAGHTATRLQALHPLYSERNNGNSEVDYYNKTQTFCH